MAHLTLLQISIVILATLVAFVSETVVGFGATLFAVAAAGFVVPIPELLPIVVPVNVALSTYIVVRDLPHVRWGYLFRRVLPPLAVGIPVGFAAYMLRGSFFLQLSFGLFVLALALFEMRVKTRRKRSWKNRRSHATALARSAILFLAGVVHGLFASGGPLVVYVTAKDRLDKRSFRSTLAALWLGINASMVAGYWIAGKVGRSHPPLWIALIPALVGGIVVGEWVHCRVDEQRFEKAVFMLLGISGIGLVALSLR